jgi:hypothetical protein
MGLKWFCDVSGKEVFMAPPYEVELNPDGTPQKVHVKIQNADGSVATIEQAKVKYKQEKAYLIRLSVGDESIQRVLCEAEMTKIKDKLKEAWDILEKLCP